MTSHSKTIFTVVKNWCWIIVMLAVLGSCLDSPECLRSGDNALKIKFTRLSDNKPDTVILFHISATGADSVFYKSSLEPDELDTLRGTALLSVNPFADETLFTFVFDGDEKVLKVGYRNEMRFVSEECGTELTQYELKILETQFDSVRVVANRLSKSNETNIEIFN